MDASHVYVRTLALGCFRSHISTRTFRRVLTSSLHGQLRGNKEYPFSGVTKCGRVWRKVPESDARSVCEGVSLGVKTMLDVYHCQCLDYLRNESANTPPKLCKHTKSVSCYQRVVLYIGHKTLENKTLPTCKPLPLPFTSKPEAAGRSLFKYKAHENTGTQNIANVQTSTYTLYIQTWLRQ